MFESHWLNFEDSNNLFNILTKTVLAKEFLAADEEGENEYLKFIKDLRLINPFGNLLKKT